MTISRHNHVTILNYHGGTLFVGTIKHELIDDLIKTYPTASTVRITSVSHTEIRTRTRKGKMKTIEFIEYEMLTIN